MHQKNIAHRDIKPENILIDSIEGNALQIKITDFGFAQYYDKQEKLTEVLGSPIYMPPEIIKAQKYDSKADIWSASVVVFIMLSGSPPFIGDDKDAVYKAICENQLFFPDKEWNNISPAAKEFVTLGLRKKQDMRPTSMQMLNHPWLNDESMSVEGASLENVVKNFQRFSLASPF